MERYLGQIREADADGLEGLRVELFGKKGVLTLEMRDLKDVSPEDRPQVGREINLAKTALEEAVESRREALAAAGLRERFSQETLDVTLPGRPFPVGHIHPLSQVEQRLESIFVGMGFEIKKGPDIEDDWHNFESLNFPKDHPSRDMQESFQLEGEWLLRTHTSPVQMRTMLERAPEPIRIIAPGRVYRRDDDATHSPFFHQIEGLVVGPGISMAHLKATLYTLARQVYGENVRLRLRPSFFPFTEPSAELDIGCVFCQQAGCRVCKGTGWLEILGCGLVHPNVLVSGGYDPEKVSGFAFGMGLDRITMLYFGVSDIRLLFQGDLRFLTQF